jgi:hypothetical protein
VILSPFEGTVDSMETPCCPGRKHQPDPSEEESYRDGFLCGLTWKDAWETHGKPGGPWILSNCPRSYAANKAWIRGWDTGHGAKLAGHFAVTASPPDFSFRTVIGEPRHQSQVRSLQSQITEHECILEELHARLAAVLASAP